MGKIRGRGEGRTSIGRGERKQRKQEKEEKGREGRRAPLCFARAHKPDVGWALLPNHVSHHRQHRQRPAALCVGREGTNHPTARVHVITQQTARKMWFGQKKHEQEKERVLPSKIYNRLKNILCDEPLGHVTATTLPTNTYERTMVAKTAIANASSAYSARALYAPMGANAL